MKWLKIADLLVVCQMCLVLSAHVLCIMKNERSKKSSLQISNDFGVFLRFVYIWSYVASNKPRQNNWIYVCSNLCISVSYILCKNVIFDMIHILVYSNACSANQKTYKFLDEMNSFCSPSILLLRVWILNKVCLNSIEYLYIELIFVFFFSPFLYSQVSEPILAKTFHRKIQSKKVFTHRESFDAIIAKTEEKLAQVRINQTIETRLIDERMGKWTDWRMGMTLQNEYDTEKYSSISYAPHSSHKHILICTFEQWNKIPWTNQLVLIRIQNDKCHKGSAVYNIKRA